MLATATMGGAHKLPGPINIKYQINIRFQINLYFRSKTRIEEILLPLTFVSIDSYGLKNISPLPINLYFRSKTRIKEIVLPLTFVSIDSSDLKNICPLSINGVVLSVILLVLVRHSYQVKAIYIIQGTLNNYQQESILS